MHHLTADDVIARFDLSPLEGEGGYFCQTWIREGDTSDEPVGTAILYLVTPESFSALHRLRDDEVFHFYLGDPCISMVVDQSGNVTQTTLGSDILAGMQVQHVVPAGTWQGTRLAPGGSWALLGTTMAPGFHLSGFELADETTLEGFRHEVANTVRELIAPRR
jgi:uncharacterized protein